MTTKNGSSLRCIVLSIRKLALICLSAGAIVGFEVAAKANVNLVQNGSFSTTSLNASGLMTTSNVADWSTSSYTFLVFPGTAQTGIGRGVKLYSGLTNKMPSTSPDGGNFVASDGAYETGAITQTIHGLVNGQSYVVSFFQAGAQQQGYNGATTDRFRVSLGAESELSDVLTNPTHDFQAWEKESLTFVATGATEVLSFLSVGTPAGVPPFTLLDGVSLESASPTPEPAYMALVGLGLLGISIIRRRQNKRA